MPAQISFFLSILLLSSTTLASDEPAGQAGWNNVEGISVQSEERVKQINAYKKQQRKEEIRKSRENWDIEGVEVQSDERVKHLNELERTRREAEIGELKCTMCMMRCELVSKAGKNNCVGNSPASGHESCKDRAQQFLQACQEQCETCQLPDL